jgi:hypothetical protein
MHRTFVPDRWRLVTGSWIDHSVRQIGPMPFVTTKTFGPTSSLNEHDERAVRRDEQRMVVTNRLHW